MRYISTRGGAPAVGFVDALLGGLAPDGGLYQPQDWPAFDSDALASLAGRPYADVAAEVLGLFCADEIAPEALARMCAEAYASFDRPAVTPLRQLSPDRWLLELFHGPSLAFKDVALQLLARLYDHVLAERGERAMIVCATSGDTGGAAVEAFRGRKRVRLVTLFPSGRISDVQRRFITTASEPNVRAFALDGDFDDCQALVKALFADPDFTARHRLSAVNSINFVRIAAQAVYYLVAGLALGAPHRPVAFAVPTGNFGDAFAGWVAGRLGLPIERILIATNANDILARALAGGRYARAPMTPTASPAMDIQSASNFERLIFETTGRDAVVTRRMFEQFAQSGSVEVPAGASRAMATLFTGATASDAAAAAAIASTLSATGELVDPHTAVALAALESVPPTRSPVVVLATADPAKFPETVLAACGVRPAAPQAARRVALADEHYRNLADDLGAVRAAIEDFAAE
ncbi:MAG TPA: threonine synthase [Caulobacteraceae bacterium]|jgi:threonine synthase|nr:threonine synthase [Caulobacteraceae bacterium]